MTDPMHTPTANQLPWSHNSHIDNRTYTGIKPRGPRLRFCGTHSMFYSDIYSIITMTSVTHEWDIILLLNLLMIGAI